MINSNFDSQNTHDINFITNNITPIIKSLYLYPTNKDEISNIIK